jgi:hypothetical protein
MEQPLGPSIPSGIFAIFTTISCGGAPTVRPGATARNGSGFCASDKVV